MDDLVGKLEHLADQAGSVDVMDSVKNKASQALGCLQ